MKINPKIRTLILGASGRGALQRLAAQHGFPVSVAYEVRSYARKSGRVPEVNLCDCSSLGVIEISTGGTGKEWVCKRCSTVHARYAAGEFNTSGLASSEINGTEHRPLPVLGTPDEILTRV